MASVPRLVPEVRPPVCCHVLDAWIRRLDPWRIDGTECLYRWTGDKESLVLLTPEIAFRSSSFFVSRSSAGFTPRVSTVAYFWASNSRDLEDGLGDGPFPWPLPWPSGPSKLSAATRVEPRAVWVRALAMPGWAQKHDALLIRINVIFAPHVSAAAQDRQVDLALHPLEQSQTARNASNRP